MGLKTIGSLLICFSLLLAALIIVSDIRIGYKFEKKYGSYWELADRSSTLEAKEQYITQFVDALEKNNGDFAVHNALFLKTPQNAFENNVEALITLRDRLKEVKGMNKTSFEYQTAIQQITAQEQGEADLLMDDIKSAYYLEQNIFTWEWVEAFSLLMLGIIFWVGVIILMVAFQIYD